MSANERRAEIIKILEGRRKESVANLAILFNVSVRTIKYDIEALMCEYPIETVRGNGGCVKLMDGYRTYQNNISAEQQNMLIALMETVDEKNRTLLRELLHAHGSIRNREILEGS